MADPSPLASGENDGVYVPFGAVPFNLVASGAIQRLTERSDVAVYLVLAAHCRAGTWTASPSLNRIAELSGVGLRTVPRAVDRLVRAGVVTVERGGGAGITTRYHLVTNCATMNGTVSSKELRQQGGIVSALKLCHSEGKTVPSKGENCAIRVAQEDREEKEDSSRPLAAADESITEQNRRALQATGMGRSSVDELAATAGVTPASVEVEWRKVQAKGGEIGMLVENLRARARQAVVAEADAERRAAQKRAKAQQRERAQDALLPLARGVVAVLTAADRTELGQRGNIRRIGDETDRVVAMARHVRVCGSPSGVCSPELTAAIGALDAWVEAHLDEPGA